MKVETLSQFLAKNEMNTSDLSRKFGVSRYTIAKTMIPNSDRVLVSGSELFPSTKIRKGKES